MILNCAIGVAHDYRTFFRKTSIKNGGRGHICLEWSSTDQALYNKIILQQENGKFQVQEIKLYETLNILIKINNKMYVNFYWKERNYSKKCISLEFISMLPVKI